jgi:hypothetical protein
MPQRLAIGALNRIGMHCMHWRLLAKCLCARYDNRNDTPGLVSLAGVESTFIAEAKPWR